MSGVNPGKRAAGISVTETSLSHRVNEDIIQAALAALPHRDQAALRDAAPALRDLTASIDVQADERPPGLTS
jgi:hypothetical protein